MKFNCSNENHFALAEQGLDNSVLYCISNKGNTAKMELSEKIMGLSFLDEKLYCVAHVRNKDSYAEKIVLHTFDTQLNELSLEELTEDYQYNRLSAMAGELLYILDFENGSTSLEVDSKSFDVVSRLNFTKINIKTGERNEWDLDDWNDAECSHALVDLISGYVTDIEAVHVFEGQLMLECMVYNPDCVIETDDPDYNEDEKSDFDYVEWHSFPETICANIKEKELTDVYCFYSEFTNPDKYKLPFGGPEQQILNAVTLGQRTYLATDFNFYCIATSNQKYAVECWYRMGYNPDDELKTKYEKYRYFYGWNDKLIFEVREGSKIVGFRICPAVFKEPSEQKWTEVKLG